MKIAAGSDHAGFLLKDALLPYLRELGHEVIDLGAANGSDSVDYPDYAEAVSRKVVGGEADLGLLVCGTGIGISIAANKVHGIRAAVCADTFSARMSRIHNDANVLCMGGRVVGLGLAQDIVKSFLDARFEGGRHARRIAKIGKLDDTYHKPTGN